MIKHLFEAALSYRDKGQLTEAEAHCQKVLKIDPIHGQTHQLLASIYHIQGNHDEAIFSLERAIKLNPAGPDTAEFFTNLGNLFMRAGNIADGAHCYQQALVFDPNYIIALYNCAVLADGQQKPQEAMDYYQRMLAIDPRHAYAHNNLGALYLNADKLDEARLHFQQALDTYPDYGTALSNLGITNMRSPDTFEEALPYLQKAVELQPNNVQSASNLTLYYGRAGNFSEALKHFQNTASMHPDPASWKNLLDTLFHVRGNSAFTDQIKQMMKSLVVPPSLLKKLYASLTLFAYIDHKPEDCRYYVGQGKAIKPEKGAEHDLEMRWVPAFLNYLEALVHYQQQHPALYNGKKGKDFYAVGESHCLSPAHTSVTLNEQQYRVVPRIVTGCKIWHLINPAANHYKTDFIDIIDTLPKKLPLLLTIGEIDCRSDEGIMTYTSRHPDIDIASYINSMATKYIDFIAALTAKKQHLLFIQGVPAPICGADEKTPALEITRLWNEALRKATKKAGMHFIDCYQLTADNEGRSSGRYHIDGNHLYPHYLQELLDRL